MKKIEIFERIIFVWSISKCSNFFRHPYHAGASPGASQGPGMISPGQGEHLGRSLTAGTPGNIPWCRLAAGNINSRSGIGFICSRQFSNLDNATNHVGRILDLGSVLKIRDKKIGNARKGLGNASKRLQTMRNGLL